MNDVSVKQQFFTQLPKLATLALVLWGMSSSSHMGGASSLLLRSVNPAHISPQAKASFDESLIRVLSRQDATLYRAAFAAQGKGDWAFADAALSHLDDKRLVGHILADRYARRGISLDEARLWMASYGMLSEAPAIYAEAKRLKDFSKAQISAPQTVPEWQGYSGESTDSRFPAANDNGEPVAKNKVDSEINTALRRGSPDKARDILGAALNRGALPITRTEDQTSRIAAAFFYAGDIENARTMARTAAGAKAPLGLWIEGLSAWKQGDFGTASHSFTTLANVQGLSAWNQSAAAFWAYRASSRLGDKSQAYRWLAEAARYPQSFYGAMASRLMAKQTERSWKMPSLNQEDITLLESQPSGWQALALVQVGRTDIAENELRRVLSLGSREMQTAALALAEKARMPSLLMQLAGVATQSNGKPLDAALYPVPPWQPAGGFTVDRALIYAIMRHESQFDPAAVSSRGACGLMQIMPSTARHITNESSGRRAANANCPDHLFNPATNIDMGQKYVRLLAEKPMIGDNLLFLLAAYNGGPGNLARWLTGNDRSDPLLFVESLPVRETRDYVQQVLLHYWAYRARLSEPDTAAFALAKGEWPRYALNSTPAIKRADAQGIALVADLEPFRLTGTR